MEDLTGKQFGAYRIVGPLGEGGMASVYKAYQANMDRYVALKILPSYFARDPEYVARFKHEARVLAKLQHLHILPVHDFGEADGYTYIVMPYVESGGLDELMKKRPLSLSEIERVIAQLASALDYAHSRGVVHRDVKPSNVLLDQQGNCLLTDFGIAKIVSSTVAFTRTGGIIGTPAYMSPEQIRGESLDGRSDIYSLGVILYELTTGQTPFRAETPAAIFVKHLHDPLPPPHIRNPEIHPSIERVILKALSKDREERFQTTGEMANALRVAIAESQGKIPEGEELSLQAFPDAPRRMAETEWQVPKRSRPRFSIRVPVRLPIWAWAIGGVAVLGAIALGLWAASLIGPSRAELGMVSPEPEVITLTMVVEGSKENEVGRVTRVTATNSTEPQVEPEETIFPVSTRFPTRTPVPDDARVPIQVFFSSSADYARAELILATILESETLTVEGAPQVAQMKAGVLELEQEYERALEGNRLSILQAVNLVAPPGGHRLALSLSHPCLGRTVLEVYNLITGRPILIDRLVLEGDEGCGRTESMSIEMELLASTDLPPTPTPFPTESPARVFFYQARDLLHEGQLEAAIELLDQAVASGWENSELFAERARVCREWKFAGGSCSDDQIIADFSHAIELDLENTRFYMDRGWAYHDSGQNELGLADLNKVIELDPNWAEAWNARAVMYRDTGNLDAAISDHDRAIEMEPETAYFYGDRGWTEADLGNFDLAFADLNRALELEPRNAWYYRIRAEIDKRVGDWQGAVEDMNRSIEIDSSDPYAFFDRALIYRDLGELDAAIADLNRVLELDDQIPWVYHDLGWAYADLGNENAARQEFETFLRMTAGNSDYYDGQQAVQNWLDGH